MKKSQTANFSSTSSTTTPHHLPSKPFLTRGMSMEFNAATGAKQSSHILWEESSWEKFGRSRGKTMDRGNSFVGYRSRAASDALKMKEHEGAVAIVDPFSTGAHLVAEAVKSGFKVVRVLSIWDSPVAALVMAGLNLDYCATIQYDDRLTDREQALADTVKAMSDLPFQILAVIPGAETGVELADQLSSRLNLRSNGTDGSLARRNKYHMGNKVRESGVRAVIQENCTNLAQVQGFLRNLEEKSGKTKCVVKPVQSAGSDDVFLCNTAEEAITAFESIHMKRNGLGLINESVLVQEFLIGKEYVIDKVSRDGVHKLVAIWEYDKRSVNGAHFVYFGMKLRSAESAMMQVMISYADKVLDALGINEGPSHMEIMLNTITTVDPVTGAATVVYDPCLVEVGSRCHGGEGTWVPVTMECIGYSQVTVTLDAYLGGSLFDSMDKDSYPMVKAGRDVDLVSRHGGIARSFPGDAVIRKLKSFRAISWEKKPGDYVPITIDCFTRPGCVQLVGDTEEQVDADMETIHNLENLALIDYSVICPKPPSVGAVVVVDPFSSGANLAAMILQWGYKLILVFSEVDSPVASLVSKGTNINPTLLIQHDSNHPNEDFAIQKTIREIEGQGAPVLAILPGAETGVELAEKLASRYGTRTNGEEYLPSRRNKYNMQESVRAGGVRAVQQRLCRSEEDITEFMTDLLTVSGGLKCVVKPNESAGSDSVYLCNSQAEVTDAWKLIHGHTNGLGMINDGALMQEFLSGTEFVIDGVSRDGVYKVVAVWEYDKRSVNNANFVYFGMKLRDSKHPEIRTLIDYSQEVITALQIYHGPSHMEVMSCQSVLPSGEVRYTPCLVEVGTRCHGGEGSWLPVAHECVGYTQLDATLNCYLRPDRFDALPKEPTLMKSGCEAFLVSHEDGNVKDIPGITEIRALESFRRLEMMTQPGAALKPTIDCFTRPGSVQLVNSVLSKLDQDYNEIRRLEQSGLFELA